jgi:phosphoribosylanthranilate isomerase
MVKVKICGITNWADARKSVEAGAHFLGFNFYRKSPRYITPALAGQIIKRLPKGIKTVGVFVNETEENILATAEIAGLHQVQLHGDESADMVARLRRGFPVIKALRVDRRIEASLLDFANADALLLDAADGNKFGGTGTAFDWNVIRGASVKTKLFLAGGLTPENIVEAIRIGRPYAVDVCSGVEARPGKKDPKRVTAFMRAVSGTKPSRKPVARLSTRTKARKRA